MGLYDKLQSFSESIKRISDIIADELQEEDNTIDIEVLSERTILSNYQEHTESPVEENKKNSGAKHLIVQRRSFGLSSIAGALMNHPNIRDLYDVSFPYKVFDENGTLRYYVSSSEAGIGLLLDASIYYVFDGERNKVGIIKEGIIDFHIPLLEEKGNSRTVYIGDSILTKLRRGEQSRQVELTEGIVKMKQKGKEFTLYNKHMEYANLTQCPLHLKSDYIDSFIIDVVDDRKYEIIAVLMAIALDSSN